MASAVLTAIRPNDLAVYDTNANDGLKLVCLELPLNADPHYSEFLKRIEQCREEARALRGHRWSAHEVDLALYELGKDSRDSSGSQLER